jgi:anti-sigma regulatory factor (Ser/Thr protein kinase)
VSSRLARELVREVVAGPEDPRVALVVTELVTNAVKHAESSPRLTVRWDGSTLRIGVFDQGSGRPIRREAASTSTSGRGLALVEAVADNWGVDERADGKVVWAELQLGPSPAHDA